MKLVDYAQRSAEWLEWRQGGISASEVSILVDANPHKTIWRLWMEKKGKAKPEDLSKNPNVQRGVKMEDTVRVMAENYLDCGPLLAPCAESDERTYVRASFDGLTIDGNIPVELKSVSQKQFDLVESERTESEVYQLYYWQVLCQMYVAEADHGYLFVAGPNFGDQFVCFKIEANEQDLTKLLKAIDEFQKKLINNKQPKKDAQRDVFYPEDEAQATRWSRTSWTLADTAAQIKELKGQIEMLEVRKKLLAQDAVSEMGEFLTADALGVAVTRSFRPGNVDYSALLEAKGITVTDDELEAHRKPGSESVLIRSTGRDMPKRVCDEDLVAVYENIDCFRESDSFF
ncbi:lambda-exonuclease family protein [uncultured Umboniibacter sp.]|uniref:YqaJ viral recombinase family nuclease n=1 Tax=uncultured Umboniibacter sp. TaxID=1798917 RepID=UPI00263991D6|nr:YqaJ viral recombinase family protein [uncultured Umboniibacter sp.]